MIHIIEGANFVGKTSTLEELRKKTPESLFVYHPRFNDHEHYDFTYNRKNHVGTTIPIKLPVHRDVVYQISHTVCLKYLHSFKDKNIILDRTFISEMVYNEYIDMPFYEQLIEMLKNNFDYMFFLLICDDDEELKRRINVRLEADTSKGYGVRVGDLADPNTVEEKFKTQKLLTERYKEIIKKFDLNHIVINTSNIPQSKVAEMIYINMSGRSGCCE